MRMSQERLRETTSRYQCQNALAKLACRTARPSCGLAPGLSKDASTQMHAFLAGLYETSSAMSVTEGDASQQPGLRGCGVPHHCPVPTCLRGALQATRVISFASVWRRHFPPLALQGSRMFLRSLVARPSRTNVCQITKKSGGGEKLRNSLRLTLIISQLLRHCVLVECCRGGCRCRG